MKHRVTGLSLVELMIALVVGLFLIGSSLTVYFSEAQTYRTTHMQGLIQHAEDVISETLLPTLRGAGFAGCTTVKYLVSEVVSSNQRPLGSLNTLPAAVMGYQGSAALTAFNAPNESSVSAWTPSLDPGLSGYAQSSSDVVVVLSAVPNSEPVGVTRVDVTQTFDVTNATQFKTGNLAALSDGLKGVIFQITRVAGNTLTYQPLSGSSGVRFPVGSQCIPMQQNAFFVGQQPNGQSALMSATLNSNTYTVNALVPGVDDLKVRYGVCSNGQVTQYVTASNVTDWGSVCLIQLGLLIAGQTTTGGLSGKTPTTFTLFGKPFSTPKDNRLRHVTEMTVYLRNNGT